MRKQTLACTTECDWSRHLALLADKACGESFQKQPKSQNRQKIGLAHLCMMPSKYNVFSTQGAGALG